MQIDITINSSTHSFALPDGWEGLTKQQWVAAIYLKVITNERGNTASARKVRRYIGTLCHNKHKGALKALGILELMGIVEAMEWLHEMPSHTTSYMRSCMLLKGPADNMINVVLMQLGLMQQFMKMVRVVGDANGKECRKAMVGLMAVTHRPYLLPWNNRMCDVYMWLYKWLPTKVLVLNMYNTWGMMDKLRQRYEWVYNDDEASDGPDHGFRALLENLAGDKFGDYYQTQKAKLHDVMVHMDLNGWRQHKINNPSKSIF
jgi:hypothetical protein